jgi:signal transduction histidine kinase
MMQAMFRFTLDHNRLLRYTGLFTYLAVGLPFLSNWTSKRLNQLQRPSMTLLVLVASYVIFGALYWLLTRDMTTRRHWGLKLVGLAVMTAAGFLIGWASHSGLAALFVVVMAVVLPQLVPLWVGVGVILVQHLLLVGIFWSFPEFGLAWSVLQSVIYMGITVLAFVVAVVAGQQAEERERQRQLNSELRATRALLAESSRIAERMRISRELHDLVGHHLTALTLNLEVASHLAQPPAAEHVRKAQATAKQLLTDVREVVSELRQDAELDLTHALNTLVEGVPGLRVHLSMPSRFAVEDPQRAQVLLRWVQEVLTNTVRHAHARNLWLRIERTDDGELCLDARDDGRGASIVEPGNGLNGMRERLAEVGGRLEIPHPQPQGFRLQAWLPLDQEVGASAYHPAPPDAAA